MEAPPWISCEVLQVRAGVFWVKQGTPHGRRPIVAMALVTGEA